MHVEIGPVCSGDCLLLSAIECEGFEREFFIFFELFDFHLCAFEVPLAGFEEVGSLLVFVDEFVKWGFAGFHFFDEGFELGQCVFKGRFG